MSDPGAPICQLPNQGQTPPSQPGRMFPPVPKAQDLPSALAAVNILTQIVNFLSAPSLTLGSNNNVVINNKPSQQVGFPTFLGKTLVDQAQSQKTPRFVEVGRTTETVKVVNPDDESNFVIVKRINALTLMDRVTGGTLYWHR